MSRSTSLPPPLPMPQHNTKETHSSSKVLEHEISHISSRLQHSDQDGLQPNTYMLHAATKRNGEGTNRLLKKCWKIIKKVTWTNLKNWKIKDSVFDYSRVLYQTSVFSKSDSNPSSKLVYNESKSKL